MCKGEYDFLKKIHWYEEKAVKVKEIFLSNGFNLVYADDLGENIADGFYFTICWKNMTGDNLLYHILLFGLTGIPLSITGSTREGLRICVSLIEDTQIDELKNRVSNLKNYLTSNI